MAVNVVVKPSKDWDKEKFLLEPYQYLAHRTGNRIRINLMEAFNHWLEIPQETTSVVLEILEMLHNSSILIDDIEDNSILRRGIPVAHNVFGIASTINCANYIYFLTLHKLLTELPKDNFMDAVFIFSQQMLKLHRGQGMENHWRDTYICPTEKQYLTMVTLKAGGLFGFGVKLLQLFSKKKYDFSRIIDLLGFIFQIRDDYLNLKSNYTDNKSFCEDLTEGKFSFPIAYAIKLDTANNTLLSILRKRTTNYEVKKFAVDYMEELGAFKYTLQTLQRYDEETRDEIQRLGGNDKLIQLLDCLRVDTANKQ